MYLNLIKMKRHLVLSGFLILGLSACGGETTAPEPVATSVPEVESALSFESQATVGADSYATNCASCHGANLEGTTLGPLLSGFSFVQRWGTQTPALLLGNIQSNMPPGGNENISDEDYLNIVAHILNIN